MYVCSYAIKHSFVGNSSNGIIENIDQIKDIVVRAFDKIEKVTFTCVLVLIRNVNGSSKRCFH